MRLRVKLLISHGLIALTMGAVCILCVFALTLADRSRSQLRATYDELHALNTLGSQVNHFAEQIAELFPMQAEGSAVDEKNQARDDLINGLADLEARVRRTLEAPGLPPEHRAHLEWQLSWLPSAGETAAALDRVADRIEIALQAGREEQAARLYAVEVENRLDARISRQIEEAVEREGVEVAATLDRSDRLTRLSWLLALSVLAIGALAAVANAILLDRLVSRPVAALARDVDELAGTPRSRWRTRRPATSSTSLPTASRPWRSRSGASGGRCRRRATRSPAR
jgi:hypothetical protein